MKRLSNANQGHLQERGHQDALFISDPTNGDTIVIGPIEQLRTLLIPDTADGHELTTTTDLLERLDFEAYDAGFNLVEV